MKITSETLNVRTLKIMVKIYKMTFIQKFQLQLELFLINRMDVITFFSFFFQYTTSVYNGYPNGIRQKPSKYDALLSIATLTKHFSIQNQDQDVLLPIRAHSV